MHCTSRSLLKFLFKPAIKHSSLPPSFLIPSLSLSTIQTSTFSTTPPTQARKDRNKTRGISALRHTGLRARQKLSVKLENLPKPVTDPERRSKVEVSPTHGLWDFFNKERAALSTPEELESHGRAWKVGELRRKDWDDLWRLWWVCAKERNRIMTFMEEKRRIGKMFGDKEAMTRMRMIKKTQNSIKHVLTERWYTWDNARYAAMEDEEVNLYATGTEEDPVYRPRERERESDTAAGSERASEASSPQQSVDPSLPPSDSVRPTPDARI